jgi:two-component system, sensor histidine kinase
VRWYQVVICALIERLGHIAEVVGNGRQAVAAMARRSFDLVLMDVMMPDMDGLEATRLIRAMPPPRCRVPVIALTAHAAPADHVAFHAAGMDSVLTKPVTAKALADAMAPTLNALALASAPLATT